MHFRPVIAACVAFFPVAILATSCGGSGKVEASTAANPPGSSTYTPPPTGPAPTGPAPTGPAPTTTPPAATPSSPATPIAPMAAAVVAPLLSQMGQAEAPGAQPDGSPFAGQFAAGQTLEQTINIKGNGCYTVVGASVGIQQLDIQLVIQPAPQFPPAVVAQSTPSGPNATLGGKAAGCWRNPTPFAGTGKVIMKATSGAGLAAAQVFSK